MKTKNKNSLVPIFLVLQSAGNTAKRERFIIIRGGKDKAEIGLAEEAATRRAEQAAKTIRELRENFQPLGIPVKEAIEDGRA